MTEKDLQEAKAVANQMSLEEVRSVSPSLLSQAIAVLTDSPAFYLAHDYRLEDP
jgi:hypothetical protein